MKLNILWAAGVAGLLFSACSNRETPFTIPDEEIDAPTGQLSTAELLLSITIDDDVRTRAEVDTKDFIVEIHKGSVLKYSYSYASLPEVITLPEGDDYSVHVKSDKEAKEADWEAPYYVGEQTFAIEANKVTQVEKVVCKRDNVRVTVRYDEDLLPLLSDDAKVVVDAGEGRSVNLEFTKDETRDGYFAHNDNWNTLAAHFTGSIDGNEENFSKLYDNVRPGDHFIITYIFSAVDNPKGEGHVGAEAVYIDTRVERVDREGKVTVIEEVINNVDRPSDGKEENPDPDDPTPVDPVVEGPTVVAEAPIDLDKVNPVNGESNVVLHISSKTGITGFTVKIESDKLTPDELSQIGLSSDLDLVNPGELETGLRGLGFPVGNEVNNQTEVTFNISNFMPMLCGLGNGDHNFVLTISDASGTIEKTLKLKATKEE